LDRAGGGSKFEKGEEKIRRKACFLLSEFDYQYPAGRERDVCFSPMSRYRWLEPLSPKVSTAIQPATPEYSNLAENGAGGFGTKDRLRRFSAHLPRGLIIARGTWN
jgi:hypothetical protein